MNPMSQTSARDRESDAAAHAAPPHPTVAPPDAHAAPPEAWDALAADYDRFVAPGEASIATEALRLAGLRRGERLLDVAAGTGGLALPAARLGAKVVATDWSAKMIERFEARVREEGLRDAQARVMDCHGLDFDDDAFDIAGSQFGVMLVPDQATALREMVRVTRPGGRVLVIAYGDPAEFEALQLFIAALASVVAGFEGLPDDPPPLEFQLADPETLRTRLIAAGAKKVFVHTAHRESIEVRSGRDLWDWCRAGNPIPSALAADLSPEQRHAVLRVLDEAVRARADASGTARLTAPLTIGVGIV
jgi:ubiquinone/menaquinone biosynthesis C-methylase UbiE